MLWVKAFHIIAVIAWFAGLFYLPRLFVYHAETSDGLSLQRFRTMERRLYHGIMTPASILAFVLGLVLWLYYDITGGWLHAKLALVTILLVYHHWCGRLLKDFAAGRNSHSARWYRWFNEVPTLLLVGIVVLVVVKPF